MQSIGEDRELGSGSLGEESAQLGMFVHRILAVFEERPLVSRGRAVLVLLVGGIGGIGGIGVVGFLAERSFLCSTVWHGVCSTH